MKIAVISDTHRKFNLAKEALNHLISLGAEYIVHAGDICEYDTISYIINLGLPYIAVYGNNDAHMVQYHNEFKLVKEPYYFKIKEIKFKLMHLPFYMTPDCDVVIFGHTHIFEAKKINETLFLNPGEVCAREKPKSEYVLLEVLEDKFMVKYFAKDIKTNQILTKEYKFER
jgi:putative phosphoesterase